MTATIDTTNSQWLRGALAQYAPGWEHQFMALTTSEGEIIWVDTSQRIDDELRSIFNRRVP